MAKKYKLNEDCKKFFEGESGKDLECILVVKSDGTIDAVGIDKVPEGPMKEAGDVGTVKHSCEAFVLITNSSHIKIQGEWYWF